MAQGLGAPVGSIVAGPKDFIAKVHHHRKMLGGGMRQAGVLAAPGGWQTACLVATLEQSYSAIDFISMRWTAPGGWLEALSAKGRQRAKLHEV